MPHVETHLTHRIGWLRAAVLGANDGILSTASIVIGVSAANTTRSGVFVAGMAGLVAGAMSMAAGEYVSVSSQADTEAADIELERRELATDPDGEFRELADLYQERGLDPQLARQVAEQLMAHDALGAHTRDELGITETLTARPIQAALTSAATFATGAALPLITAAVSSDAIREWVVGATSLLSLAILGVVGARSGGARAGRAAARVTFWGALAMGITALIGRLVGAMG